MAITRKSGSKKKKVAVAEVVTATAGNAVAVSSESVSATKSSAKTPSQTLEPIVEEEKEEEVDAIEYFSPEAQAVRYHCLYGILKDQIYSSATTNTRSECTVII